MTELFKILAQNIKQLPTLAQLLIVPVLIGVYMLVKSLLSNRDIQSNMALRIKKFQKRIDKNDLLSHDLFINAEFYKQKVKLFRFDEPAKRDLLKIVLTDKINVVIKSCEDIIRNESYEKADRKQLSKMLIDATNKMVKDYERLILSHFTELHQDNAKCIFELIMHSENGFNVYHSQNVLHLFRTLEIISASDVFDDNKERLSMFLHEIDNALKTAVFDVEVVFRNLNGNLTKLIKTK